MHPIDNSILLHFNLEYFDDNLISADVTDKSVDLLLSPLQIKTTATTYQMPRKSGMLWKKNTEYC